MTERIAKDHLKAFVERIERLEEEKKSIADDIRDVYAEAKSNGFDTKALREIIKRRTWDRDELAEHDAIVDTYKLALGMLVDTPLGEAAIKRATEGSSEEGKTTRSAHVSLAQMKHLAKITAPCATTAEVLRSDPIAGWSSPEAREAHNEYPAATGLQPPGACGPERVEFGAPILSSRGGVECEHAPNRAHLTGGFSVVSGCPTPGNGGAKNGVGVEAASRELKASIAGVAPGPRETTSPAQALDQQQRMPPCAAILPHPDRVQSAGGERPRLGESRHFKGGAVQLPDDDMLCIPDFLQRVNWEDGRPP